MGKHAVPDSYEVRDLGWLTPCWIRPTTVSLKSYCGHVKAYVLFYGPIQNAPRGTWGRRDLSVCHLCDVHACINPRHLYLDTHHGNCLDVQVKKALWKSLASKPTRSIDAFHDERRRTLEDHERTTRQEAAERVREAIECIPPVSMRRLLESYYARTQNS